MKWSSPVTKPKTGWSTNESVNFDVDILTNNQLINY